MTEGSPRHFGAMPHDDTMDLPSALRRRESIAPPRWQMVCTLDVSERDTRSGPRGHSPRDHRIEVCVKDEIERRYRVSVDATVAAMAQTAKDMNTWNASTRSISA